MSDGTGIAITEFRSGRFGNPTGEGGADTLIPQVGGGQMLHSTSEGWAGTGPQGSSRQRRNQHLCTVLVSINSHPGLEEDGSEP